VTSDTASAIFSSYSTPQRRYYPPSDIESELEAETSFINSSGDNNNSANSSVAQSPSGEARKLNKLLDVYKTKYTQLKNAYDEVEAEKEKIKAIFLVYLIYFLLVNFLSNYLLISSRKF
jgi:hypothetical protein